MPFRKRAKWCSDCNVYVRVEQCEGKVETRRYEECMNRFIDLLLAAVLKGERHSLCLFALCDLSQLSPRVVG